MEKKILVSAQDAGGAVNIAPICSELKKLHFEIKIITSNVTSITFYNYNLNDCVTELNENNESFIEKIFLEFNPDIILVGTTRYFSGDRILIKLSQKYNKFSVSILDDWFHYELRFLDLDGSIIFPDIICCIDELAFSEAVNEGISESILRITGSPYFSLLYEKKNNTSLISSEIEGIIPELKKILFISETHKEDFGEDHNGGPLGDFLGYTESIVLNDIINSLLEINIRCNFVEKLHPADTTSKLSYFNLENINYIKVKNYDLHNLIFLSDLVIGMRSKALLESAVLDKQTISYQPNLNPKYGYCTAEKIAGIESIRTKEELKHYLKNFLTMGKKIDKIYFHQRPKFADKNSIKNIIKIILENL